MTEGLHTSALLELAGLVDALVGFYLDTHTAYLRFCDDLTRTQVEWSARLGLSVAELDERHLIFGDGDPNSLAAVVRHRITQADWKRRIAPDGPNMALASQITILMLYESWDEVCRSALATAREMGKDEISPS